MNLQREKHALTLYKSYDETSVIILSIEATAPTSSFRYVGTRVARDFQKVFKSFQRERRPVVAIVLVVVDVEHAFTDSRKRTREY